MVGHSLWSCVALVSLCPAGVIGAAEFSTYIGEATVDYSVARVATDSAGNTYVAGTRTFTLVTTYTGTDAFVMKLDGSGKISTLASVAGLANTAANDLVLDAAGNLYLVGSTSAPDLPLRNALQSTPGPGFLAKFSPDGLLLYCTYFPAAITAIAVDSAGSMYLTGTTDWSPFPILGGVPPPAQLGGIAPRIYGAFVTKLSSAGDRIVYSAVIAGNAINCPWGVGAGTCLDSQRLTASLGIGVDNAGNAYIAGNTNTLDLPTSPGAMAATGPGPFVAKINSGGSALSYLTYLANGTDQTPPSPSHAALSSAAAMAVDPDGSVYVTGSTSDPKFPVTPGAYQTTGPVFALKLNTSGSALVWATLLGGKGYDQATAATLDTSGDLWVAGTTLSTEFPDNQGWFVGGDFVVELNPQGTALPYSGRYPDNTVSASIAVDSGGLLHLTGPNGIVSVIAASPRPVMRPFALTNAAGGIATGRIAPGEAISIYGPHIGAFPAVQATFSGMLPTALAGTQVLFDNIPAPLLYVSDSQINAMVPYEVGGHTTSDLRIVFNGVTSPPFRTAVAASQLGIFANAAVNQDGTLNSTAHRAKPGDFLSFWGTGAGWPTLTDGQIATGAASDGGAFSAILLEWQNGNSVDVPLKVAYSGAAPGLPAGIFQVNVQLPPGTYTATGITLTVVGQASVTLPVYLATPLP
jgi:uncharacterized protein (TIGR03437 family)